MAITQLSRFSTAVRSAEGAELVQLSKHVQFDVDVHIVEAPQL